MKFLSIKAQKEHCMRFKTLVAATKTSLFSFGFELSQDGSLSFANVLFTLFQSEFGFVPSLNLGGSWFLGFLMRWIGTNSGMRFLVGWFQLFGEKMKRN